MPSCWGKALSAVCREPESPQNAEFTTFPGTGWPTKSKEGFAQPGLAQRFVSGYADHMETEEFRTGVERLVDLANKAGPTAINCAEAVWWRCHRGLISDYLKGRGIEVMHILDANKTEPHPYTSAARFIGGKLSYASDRDRLI
jgi:hypothetical protein